MRLVPLASGRDADVFAIDDSRVLRRYRDGLDAAPEAAVLKHLGDLGFPVPNVYGVDGPSLVMERLRGPTMVQALTTGQISPSEAAQVLADLHDHLHRLPPLRATDDARLLHLDLHPNNVMLVDRGAVVIDWRNAGEGAPDLDLAVSALILAEVAADESNRFATAAHAMLDQFLRCAGGDIVHFLDHAVQRRRANPTLTAAEVNRLPTAAELVRTGRPGEGTQGPAGTRWARARLAH